MKTKLVMALTVLLAFSGILRAAGLPLQSGSSKLTVSYVNWVNFTDIKDRYEATEAGQLAILKDLAAALQLDAEHSVPDGDHLTLTFTNIDLAGELQPEHGGRWDNVRIVKDIYPPRFVFTYSLADASGTVLKSGKEDLTDLGFQMRVSIDRNDPLHYEKDMLNTWMERKMYR